MQRGREMIREKMFRLHRHKSSTKSGDRIDFNFSNIQALQVPKGWDKLYISLLSTETGKTNNKSGKASVRNGTCRWAETLSESVWISQDESSKELEQYIFKFVVAMGSARSSILGEATINLGGYMSSKACIPVSLHLKKCNHGTILQVEIQCLTPRTTCRDEKWNHKNSYTEVANPDYDDMENKSEVSDGAFDRSVGSSSSNHLETSFSASGSRHSFDSMEGSLGRESFSPQSNISGIAKHVIGRQDSAGLQFSAPYRSYPIYDSPGSNHSSNSSVVSGSGRPPQYQREDSGQSLHAVVTSPLQNAGSSRNFLETEEVTIDELRAQARMWERNARKLLLDQELLAKEFADQSKQLTKLDVELSASRTECNGLKQEIEHLKVLLEESMDEQKSIQKLKFQSPDNIQRVLEEETKFQKDLNDNLALQLQKTQESNLELVSILQEMEDTIGKQKMEIENLASKFGDTGNTYSFRHEDSGEVNLTEEVSAEKMRKASCDSDLEGSIVEHPLTDLHELQLQQLRESQKNLESTILNLEKTLENRNQEIEIEHDLKAQTQLDCEAKWRHKLTAKEEEIINLEAQLSKALSDRHSEVVEFEDRGDLNLLKEIETLKEKVQELERDCNELTDENLELLLKLKEATSNLPTNSASFNSSSNESPANSFPVASKSEMSKFKYQICQIEQEIKNEELPIEGVVTDHLQIRCADLENKCAHMELQLQAFKDRAEEKETQNAALQSQLECFQGEQTRSEDHPTDVCTEFEKSESRTAIVKFGLLPALFEQLQLLLVNVKKQQYTQYSPADTEYTYNVKSSYRLRCTELTTQKELEEAALDILVQLNKLFEAKITQCEDSLPCSEPVIRSTNANEVQNKLEGDNLNKNTLCACSQGINGLNKELESRVADLSKELLAKTSLIGELNADRLLKEEEVEALRNHQRDLQTQISNLQKTKEQMEQNMEIMQRESSATSKRLDNLKNDFTVLSSSMESQVSDNKVIRRKSLELESAKCELELQLSELEEENVHSSGRISGLEAQLRYLTDAREGSRLELQHSESHVMNLQDHIRRLESEKEAQKVSMKQKTEDIQNRWLEAQKECEYLNIANLKLQATAESLIEECSSLQKSNRELRQQKIELHDYCTALEVELKESQSRFSNCSKKVEALEAKLSAILEEITSKEKILNSELDALHQQNQEYKEKLVLGESWFNQMYLEKTAEVENLQHEAADLTGQIPVTHERKGTAPGNVLKMHASCAEKGRPVAALQEVQGNFKLSHKKLEIIQMTELAVSKETHETLVANHEKLLGLLEDVRSNEEKLKGTINELESKIKLSEYERLQLAEEISCLKVQLQKIPLLQDEVLALKGSLCGTKFENERLQTLLQLLSGDFEEVKTERISLLQKISSMQKATSELENCRRSKVALEEKILRLEGDLTASEALCTQDAELKNELGRIRRVNSQFQWKIKSLEGEKEEWLQRAQALGEELKQKKEVKQEQVEPSNNHFLVDLRSCATNSSADQELKLSEKKEEANILQLSKDQSESCVKTDQLQQSSESQGIIRHQRQDNNDQYDNTASSPEMAIDSVSRIQFLENELAEALEANDMYKEQLKSLLSEVQIAHSDTPEKFEAENKTINHEENKQKAALLVAELKEIRERYFNMSLQYAEVEAQREQLVMKLKDTNSGKRWFS